MWVWGFASFVPFSLSEKVTCKKSSLCPVSLSQSVFFCFGGVLFLRRQPKLRPIDRWNLLAAARSRMICICTIWPLSYYTVVCVHWLLLGCWLRWWWPAQCQARGGGTLLTSHFWKGTGTSLRKTKIFTVETPWYVPCMYIGSADTLDSSPIRFFDRATEQAKFVL